MFSSGGGSRLLLHSIVVPNVGPLQEQLDKMQARAESMDVAAWKVYTPYAGTTGKGWFLDDEELGIPIIEKAREVGVKIICAHKGLALFGFDPVFGSPRDFGVVAKQYPDMKFVHIIRDGRDVAASMLSHGFWPIAGGRDFKHLRKYTGEVSLRAAAQYWVDLLEAGRQSAARAPKGCYIEVKFEDLVENPREVLTSICQFVGEEFAEKLLEPNLDKHNMGRWKTELSEEEISLLDKIAGETLRREGYL